MDEKKRVVIARACELLLEMGETKELCKHFEKNAEFWFEFAKKAEKDTVLGGLYSTSILFLSMIVMTAKVLENTEKERR